MSEEVKVPEKCGAVARFTYFGNAVICTKPAGHEGNHVSWSETRMPLAWREGRTVEGEIGPAIDDDMRRAFEPIAKGRKEEE